MDNLLPVYAIFQGTPFDIYVHWLILVLGIGLAVCGIVVLSTCRGIAGFFHLIKTGNSFWSRFYRVLYKNHYAFWWSFAFILVLHLLITIPHLGLPKADQPYYSAQVVSFVTAITNVGLVLALQVSCRSAVSFLNVFSSKSVLQSKGYLSFYRYHNVFWWLLGASVTVHIIFGVIHAVHT